MCEAFHVDPERAEQLDEGLVSRVMFAMSARYVLDRFNAKQALDDAQDRLYATLLDALDRRDEAAGIPGEA